MNKYLEQLVALAKIDEEIDAFVPKMKAVEKKLRVALEQEDAIKSRVESFKKEIVEAKLKKNKNELHLAELSAKFKDFSKKSAAIKTDKEMKALQLEEEIAKEQCDFANEEIARLDSYIDAKNKDVQEAEATLNDVAARTQEIKISIDEQIKEIEEQRTRVYEDKQKLVAEMSQKILSFYQKIRKWAGNTTVVPVKKHACYGCFMRINDKTYSSVLLKDDIITCPHCGRILYKDLEEVEA
ncbi:MAG: zinc ribbon domain-containing protein [Sulfurospirillum sp.]|nr:zinc ribbon domain-containing protein [Sulfurospirillum sp.]